MKQYESFNELLKEQMREINYVKKVYRKKYSYLESDEYHQLILMAAWYVFQNQDKYSQYTFLTLLKNTVLFRQKTFLKEFMPPKYIDFNSIPHPQEETPVEDLLFIEEELDNLDPFDKFIIHSYYFEGKTDLAIAKQLNCSDPYVWSVRHNILRKMNKSYFG